MRNDPLRVAVVDDELEILEGYELMLAYMKIPMAFKAFDGPTALEKIKSSGPCPTVMIIDYRMPIMDGIELMFEIRKLDPRIRIIFSSGDDGIKQKALEKGADAFLLKPISIEAILECIQSLS